VGELSPADPGRPDLRVGDREREEVVDELRGHFAAGRLEMAEFEARTASALRARTRGDLTPLLADMPAAKVARQSGPPVRSEVTNTALRSYFFALWLPLNLMLILIWLLTGHDSSFWPVWPMFGTGVPMLFMLSGHRAAR
jgi:hypothetical protein